MSELTTNHAVVGRKASLRENVARAILHCWPLLSGCGTIATGAISRALVEPKPDAVWGKVEGLPCLVPLDDLVGRSIFLVGDLDRKVTRIVDRAVRRGDICVDVGANLGLVSLQMARRAGRGGRVYAVEPSPQILRYLRQTLDANKDLEIELFDCAVGRESDVLTLSVPVGNAGRATLVAGAQTGTTFQVPVRRLDELLSSAGLHRIDVLKIDVEGYEYEALSGLLDRATTLRPGIVIFEENSPAESRVFGLLKATGYEVFGIPKRSLFRVKLRAEGADGFADCHDFIAVRKDLPSNRTGSPQLPI